jgi:hypothetical protein
MQAETDVGSEPIHIWQRICLRGEKVAAGAASAERVGALLVLVIAGMRLNLGDNIEDAKPYLRAPFRKVQPEYAKEWRERLDLAEEEELEEYDEFTGEGMDEEVEDSSAAEEPSNESAEKLAKESISAIVRMASNWKRDENCVDITPS